MKEDESCEEKEKKEDDRGYKGITEENGCSRRAKYALKSWNRL